MPCHSIFLPFYELFVTLTRQIAQHCITDATQLSSCRLWHTLASHNVEAVRDQNACKCQSGYIGHGIFERSKIAALCVAYTKPGKKGIMHNDFQVDTSNELTIPCFKIRYPVWIFKKFTFMNCQYCFNSEISRKECPFLSVFKNLQNNILIFFVHSFLY